MNRIKQYYNNILEEDLLLKQNPRNIQAIMKIESITINNCSRNYLIEERLILTNLVAVELLGGQFCKKNRSKKSIANFKLLKDTLIGFQVDYQKDKLYSLLDKFFLLVAPNSKSFKAYNKNQLMTSNGITLSIQSPLGFPEFEENYRFFEHVCAFDFSLHTNTNSKEHSMLLLSGFQIPFHKEGEFL